MQKINDSGSDKKLGDEKGYWNRYYHLHKINNEPSHFASYILQKYLESNKELIELGCGNGRDSIFFAENNIKVIAVDQCCDEINFLSNHHNNKKVSFLCADFTELSDSKRYDYVYSRFTLHSIKEKEEDRTIEWAYRQLNSMGYIFIEARGLKNEFYRLGKPVLEEKDAFVFEDHYRRFIDIDILRNKLIKLGFNIIESDEREGFAPFKGTDQIFIRIVAQKYDK